MNVLNTIILRLMAEIETELNCKIRDDRHASRKHSYLLFNKIDHTNNKIPKGKFFTQDDYFIRIFFINSEVFLTFHPKTMFLLEFYHDNKLNIVENLVKTNLADPNSIDIIKGKIKNLLYIDIPK